jgi:rhamnulokinase
MKRKDTTSTFLAFDLGASTWRAVLGREHGSEFQMEEVARERTGIVERGEGLFWDLEGIFARMKAVLKEMAQRGIELASMGVDSWSVDYALLDEQGDLVEAPRSYRDRRNLGMRKKAAPQIGLRNLFLRTGVMAEDFTTLCQLTAAREQTPGLLGRAARLLFIPDLLRYWLTGVWATDFTLATTSQLYNLREHRWDEQILSSVGLKSDAMPPVSHEPRILAPLSAQMRRETGQGAVAVATGASHDTAAAFSTISADERSAILSSGTWSIMGVHMAEPIFAHTLDAERFGYEGNPDGTVRLVCNIPGMWILEQCRAAWEKRGVSHSYEELMAGAREASAFQSRIDPYDRAFEAPDDMSAAVAEFCREGGQPEPRTPFETARAIFLGLAEACARMLGELGKMTGRRLERLHVLGGGSRNWLLNQFIESAACVEVVPGEVEATAVGNIQSQKRALTGPG